MAFLIKPKLLGNWALPNKFLKDLPIEVKKSYAYAQRKVANQIYRRVRAHIRDQDMNWTPLADSTVAKKRSSDIYIDKGDYYRAIRVYNESPYTVSVGVKPGLINDKGEDLAEIAMWLEEGRMDRPKPLPARPIWNPTWQELGGRKYLSSEVINHVNRTLQIKGFKWGLKFNKSTTSIINY